MLLQTFLLIIKDKRACMGKIILSSVFLMTSLCYSASTKIDQKSKDAELARKLCGLNKPLKPQPKKQKFVKNKKS